MLLSWLFVTSAWAVPEWPREVNGQACDHTTTELVQKFKGDNLKKMSVAYYDTSTLELQNLSLTVRLRVKEDEGEVTVKLRAETLPDVTAGAECEVDVYRGRALSACSWNVTVQRASAISAMEGKFPIRDLLSKEQRTVLDRLAGSVTAPWLRYGPVAVERWEIAAGPSGKKWRLERWVVPDGKTLLHEVSFSEKKAADVEALRLVLDGHFKTAKVTRCEKDEPKTSAVLRYFSKSKAR